MAQIIRYLPEHLINQIAAGEVIERPAAVVRELVENALDAGATKIDVYMRDGGVAELAVHDNGRGMGPDDLLAAVDRHATSKLPDNHIFAIKTLGFRGEALAAIGAVSKLTITTKQADSTHGWQLHVHGGQKGQVQPASHNGGTSVVVQALFFATPARLKFMKSALSERHAVRQVLVRLALSYPHIGFTLHDEQRVVLSAPSAPDLRTRWAQLWRPDIIQDAQYVAQSLAANIELQAVLAQPTHHQATSENILFLINQRPVQDRNLMQAVRVAYGDTVPRGRYPAALIKLQLPPDDVDMNVHPAKAEVRLRDAHGIKSLLIAAIKQAVQQPFSIKPTIAPPPYYAPIIQAPMPMLAELPTHYRTHTTIENLPVAHDVPTTTWQPLVQLFDTYIVALSDQGLVLIDQHAAHERIVYEQLKNTLAAQQTLPAQQLLLPDIIMLNPLACEALLAVAEPLSALGLVIESFGSNAVAVQATPALLGANIDLGRLVHDLAELAQQDSATDFLEKRLFEIAAKMACYGSVRAGRRLTMPDMQSLLSQMANTNASGQCNHGRPTLRLLGEHDFARLFERT